MKSCHGGGTDEQIAAMLDGHYKGKLSIGDYWSVGDIRAIPIGETSDKAIDNKFVIIDIEKDNLATPINGIGIAAITVQKLSADYNVMDDKDGCIWTESWPARMKHGRWIDMIQSPTIKKLIKPVIKYTVIKTDNNSLTYEYPETVDKIFSLSYDEVYYSSITRYKYFNTTGNLIKYKGDESTEACDWILRSSYKVSWSSDSIDTEGNLTSNTKVQLGWNGDIVILPCPAFCL